MKLLLYGALIGVANIIPGLSGGSMAVILGVYNRLISAISGLSFSVQSWRDNSGFLIQLGAGVLIGVLCFSHVIEWVLTQFPGGSYAFFLGLILGGVPLVYQMGTHMAVTFKKVAVFLVFLGLLVVFSMFSGTLSVSLLDEYQGGIGLLWIFVSGVIAAGTMVLPGVSGSMMLVVLGTYGVIIQAVSNFHWTILSVLGVSVILGIVLMSRLIKGCLTQFPGYTYYALIGLMMGSIPMLWPGFPVNWVGIMHLSLVVVGAGTCYYTCRS